METKRTSRALSAEALRLMLAEIAAGLPAGKADSCPATLEAGPFGLMLSANVGNVNLCLTLQSLEAL